MLADQINQFQARFSETFTAAQKRAQARARELEVEARKILETLGDRAQAELKDLIQQAQGLSKEQVAQVGAELVKVGTRLQEIAKSWKASAADSAKAPAASKSGPPN